ncbi:MAG TPA: tetratricopeptide repeat protein, partial [Thermoanaerobaculia bacterium]|nr:tetratricopeptide repeat protein [Thermoanaerobaculia bacterium]
QNRSELAADTVDGTAKELFDVQDKLVTKIASFLDPKAAPQRFPTLDPNVSQQRYLEALGHLRRYDKEDELNAAINILEDLGTTSATVQAALGRAYLAKFVINRDSQYVTKASEYCDRAAAADPLNPDVHVTLGQVRLQSGKTGQAINEFNRALQQQPNNVDAVLGLARAYDKNEDLPKAEASYKKAIELQPKYWSAYNAIGAFYLLHGNAPASVPFFQKVIQLAPDNTRGYGNLGAAYQQMGRYDDAIGLFQRTIDRKPDAQNYSNLGTCYYFLGRYKDAARMFEKAVGLADHHYKYWANLGDAYRATVDERDRAPSAYAKAAALARAEIDHNPNDSVVRARMAECLAKSGDAKSAESEIAEALHRDGENANVLYHAAKIAAFRGDADGAARFLAHALQRGYSKMEIELEPEFVAARKTATYQHLPTV